MAPTIYVECWQQFLGRRFIPEIGRALRRRHERSGRFQLPSTNRPKNQLCALVADLSLSPVLHLTLHGSKPSRSRSHFCTIIPSTRIAFADECWGLELEQKIVTARNQSFMHDASIGFAGETDVGVSRARRQTQAISKEQG